MWHEWVIVLIDHFFISYLLFLTVINEFFGFLLIDLIIL